MKAINFPSLCHKKIDITHKKKSIENIVKLILIEMQSDRVNAFREKYYNLDYIDQLSFNPDPQGEDAKALYNEICNSINILKEKAKNGEPYPILDSFEMYTINDETGQEEGDIVTVEFAMFNPKSFVITNTYFTCALPSEG